MKTTRVFTKTRPYNYDILKHKLLAEHSTITELSDHFKISDKSIYKAIAKLNLGDQPC
ncbi:HTH domain-containing protein [Moritella viscosa]|uniref:Uncharacterized protein n=1 Tax=Moritella viscosa TaxID=80854 RepID=A0A1L0C9K1_9GAMM|nr:HTH domain-containing protein [Moritella viscosa]SGZ17322.1 Predicted protein [Moritella viscosa]